MDHRVKGSAGSVAGSGAASALIALGMTLAAAAILAWGPKLPIGPNYWDVYLFLDVAHRIDLGQTPHIDFFIPIGALPFYLFDVVHLIFPHAQPVLAVQYGTLLVAAPLAALIGADIERRSRALAVALLLPFAVFALLPFNIIDFYPSPGIDGYGIYNRSAGLMLYLLAMTLAFPGSRLIGFLTAAVVLTALAYIKITAGLAALCFIAIGVLTGRLRWPDALAAVGALAAVTAALQAATGVPGAYVGDLTGLVEDNTDSLVERALTFISLKFDVLAAVAVLGLFAAWLDRARILGALGWLAKGRPGVALGWLLAHPVALLSGLAIVATGYETQNTGSNEFIYLWPALLLVWTALAPRLSAGSRLALTVLVCFAAAPSLTKVLHKGARTAAVTAGYVPVTQELNGPLAMTVTKPVHDRRANVLADHYAQERPAWLALAQAGQKPSAIQYSEPDYQTFYVRSIAEAATGLRAFEATLGMRFRSTYVLDFVDPLTAELGRTPPRFVSVANDPDRTFPVRIRAKVAAELATIDAILIPRCPITPARLGILQAAEPALRERNIIPLSPCWDIAVSKLLPVKAVAGLER